MYGFPASKAAKFQCKIYTFTNKQFQAQPKNTEKRESWIPIETTRVRCPNSFRQSRSITSSHTFEREWQWEVLNHKRKFEQHRHQKSPPWTVCRHIPSNFLLHNTSSISIRRIIFWLLEMHPDILDNVLKTFQLLSHSRSTQ